MQERGLEHQTAARRGDGSSHMAKHQALEHQNQEPDFILKVVSYHTSALSRQVKEAIRIRRRGGQGSILNSKAEFNRAYIPRLVVEVEEESVIEERNKRSKEYEEELIRNQDLLDASWEERKYMDRAKADKKRKTGAKNSEVASGGDRKRRRRVYELLEDD